MQKDKDRKDKKAKKKKKKDKKKHKGIVTNTYCITLTAASDLIRVVCVVKWTILSKTSFPPIMIATRRI